MGDLNFLSDSGREESEYARWKAKRDQPKMGWLQKPENQLFCLILGLLAGRVAGGVYFGVWPTHPMTEAEAILIIVVAIATTIMSAMKGQK